MQEENARGLRFFRTRRKSHPAVDAAAPMWPRCAMPWPYSIPAGLRRRINGVLGQRYHGAAEIWGEVRDWLEENGVEMPDGIEVEPPPEGGAQVDQ